MIKVGERGLEKLESFVCGYRGGVEKARRMR